MACMVFIYVRTFLCILILLTSKVGNVSPTIGHPGQLAKLLKVINGISNELVVGVNF